MGEQILDLSAVVEHDTVVLPGGRERELINRGDLGLYEYEKLIQLQADSAKLSAEIGKQGMRPPLERRLMGILGETTKLLIPTITPAELGRLPRAHRERILLTWLGRNFTPDELTAAVGAAEGNAESRRTGGRSSRVSRRSTGATRKRGSTRHAG